jgi:hypothetical protein
MCEASNRQNAFAAADSRTYRRWPGAGYRASRRPALHAAGPVAASDTDAFFSSIHTYTCSIHTYTQAFPCSSRLVDPHLLPDATWAGLDAKPDTDIRVRPGC